VADYEVHGLCLSLGDWNKDVVAVSVPLLASDPNKAMAFSCSMPAQRATREHLIADVGPRLMRMRDKVAGALGSRW
jgi:DNA-binding IclR family transcriptional regulator